MVLVATRSASTSASPTQQRSTARTILLTSTGSLEPLRFFTRIDVFGKVSSAVELVGRVARNGAAPLLLGVVSLSILVRSSPVSFRAASGRSGRNPRERKPADGTRTRQTLGGVLGPTVAPAGDWKTNAGDGAEPGQAQSCASTDLPASLEASR